MPDWTCDRCGYTNLGPAGQRPPKRCPVCQSTRIRIRTAPTQTSLERTPTPQEIYAQIRALHRRPPEEQETGRRDLANSGIHILALSTKEPLSTLLPRKEAEHILHLVTKEGFALAVVEGTVAAVSPASPIRLHLGVSEPLLRELQKAAGEA